MFEAERSENDFFLAQNHQKATEKPKKKRLILIRVAFF
jgi:hypothetical protein